EPGRRHGHQRGERADQSRRRTGGALRLAARPGQPGAGDQRHDVVLRLPVRRRPVAVLPGARPRESFARGGAAQRGCYRAHRSGCDTDRQRQRGLLMRYWIFASLLLMTSAAQAQQWMTLPPTPTLPKADVSGYAPVNGVRIWYAEFGHGEPVL